MPTRRKKYEWALLPREVLRELIAKADEIYSRERADYEALHPESSGKWRAVDSSNVFYFDWGTLRPSRMDVTDSSGFTSFEQIDDFFDRLGDPYDGYSFSYGMSGSAPAGQISFSLDFYGTYTNASVSHSDMRVVDRIMSMIRDAAVANSIPIPEPTPERPRVFIGHGGSPEWQKTEQWLRNLGVDVRAYETLPHSGRTIERVLEDALGWANFALLVLTAEDERADQTMQARQNVVHELGLFQGRLGWDQALVMLEHGAAEFSNIAGTNQLRFPAAMIEAKHGDIAVALRERFPGAFRE